MKSLFFFLLFALVPFMHFCKPIRFELFKFNLFIYIYFSLGQKSNNINTLHYYLNTLKLFLVTLDIIFLRHFLYIENIFLKC